MAASGALPDLRGEIGVSAEPGPTFEPVIERRRPAGVIRGLHPVNNSDFIADALIGGRD
jgi:hypothetical protein